MICARLIGWGNVPVANPVRDYLSEEFEIIGGAKMYCGIDVAKNKSQICITDSQNKVLHEFEIEHTKEGFEFLERHLVPDVKIAMEVTGNYSKVIHNYLSKKYDVCFVDGMQMMNFARCYSPTIKNDRVDAKLLAKALTFPDLNKVNPMRMNELKDLCNLYQRVTRELSKHKRMFKGQINIIFPELEKMMTNNSNLGLANMLLLYPNPKAILSASIDELQIALIGDMGKGSGKFTIEYTQSIRDLASNSVGNSDYPTLYFKFVIRSMIHYRNLKKEITKNLEAGVSRTPYYKMIEDFGFNTASVALIIGEIGDIRRFPNYKKFVSYCGFGICETRSGTSVNKSTHISRRGNSLLRHTFYTLALVHLANKTELHTFFQRLKASGKHPKKCMVATARKVAVKTYFNMLRCHDQEAATS